MARLTKRKDGLYQAGFRFNGKRYVVYASSRADLEQKKHEKLEALKNRALQRDNPTLNTYYERFTEMRKGRIKPSTIRGQIMEFNACADVFIESAGCCLGEMKIKEIQPKDIQEVQLALADSRRSPQSVNDYLDHLSHVFAEAVKDDTVSKNPCDCIRHLRRVSPAARDTKHRALTEKETADFLCAAKDSFYLNHFKLLLLTGMRVGELAALTVADVNRKNKCLQITKTITRNEAGVFVVGSSAKTYAGKRDIPLTQNILKVINSQKKLNKDCFGLVVGAPLFPSSIGGLLKEYTINREIARLIKGSDIEPFTTHAFRATFATRWMEKAPEDFKVLSEILGHADVKITLNLYTHVTKEQKEKAMRKISTSL